MTDSLRTAWIGVDWGTSCCRAFAFDAEDRVIDGRADGPGMKALSAEDYEAALSALADAWLTSEKNTPVIVCGMAGARQGWREAPYRPVPCSVAAAPDDTIAVPTENPRLGVTILPGVCQADPAAPDVMRGEETQLLGFAARNPDFDGLVCLPGTHSKWVRLAGDRIAGFHTFMTGELFDLLTRQSILRFSTKSDTADVKAFQAAVADAAEAKAPLSAELFPIRARDLLFKTDPDRARSRLSGLLIGDEIRCALAGYDRTTPIGLVGDDTLCDLYETALAAVGNATQRVSGRDAVIDGLRHAYRAQRKSGKES